MVEVAKKRDMRVALLINGAWVEEVETIPTGVNRKEYLADIYSRRKKAVGTVRIRSAA